MKLVCDTDIVSRLAKVKSLKLLKMVFPNSEFLLSTAGFDELTVSKRTGYDFPDRIFNFVKVVSLKEKEVKEYKKLKENFSLGRTDIHNLIIAKRKNHLLLTDDQKLLNKAREKNIKSYNLLDLFKFLYNKKKKTKKEINKILDEIEEKDNTIIKNRKRIFTK